MKTLMTLAALFAPSLALAEGSTESPWWVTALQIVGPPLILALSGALGMLLRKLFRYLDAKTGVHTEEKAMAVVSTILHALEQTGRKVIAEDLADGKIDAEEAKFRLAKLGETAVSAAMGELGVSKEIAERLVAAGLNLTGLSGGPKRADGVRVGSDGQPLPG